jgi:flagellar basal body-associated protein FliL
MALRSFTDVEGSSAMLRLKIIIIIIIIVFVVVVVIISSSSLTVVPRHPELSGASHQTYSNFTVEYK